MPRRRSIPNTPLCAVVGCTRFDTALATVGEHKLPLCRAHRKQDSLIVWVKAGPTETINRINRKVV